MRFLLTLAVLALTACPSEPPEGQGKQIEGQVRLADDLTYFEDCRVGLCFAFDSASAGYGYARSMATVPCDAVKSLLVNMCPAKTP